MAFHNSTSELSAASSDPTWNTGRNVWIVNGICIAMVVIGNLVLPSVFWHTPAPPSWWSYLPVFMCGVLASEVAVIGVFASFSNSFFGVRWIWSLILVVISVVLLYLGISIAERQLQIRFEIFLMTATVASSSLAMLVFLGACVRRFTGSHFADSNYVDSIPATKSFNLLFLFKLMIAIAGIMLAVKIFPPQLRVPSQAITNLNLALRIVSFLTVHFVFCLGLIFAAVSCAMSIDRCKPARVALILLLSAGTPVLIIVSRFLVPTSMGLVLQWMLTQAFYLGFVSSMLAVFASWRKAGLRLVR
jgi:hypothetical protein